MTRFRKDAPQYFYRLIWHRDGAKDRRMYQGVEFFPTEELCQTAARFARYRRLAAHAVVIRPNRKHKVRYLLMLPAEMVRYEYQIYESILLAGGWLKAMEDENVPAEPSTKANLGAERALHKYKRKFS